MDDRLCVRGFQRARDLFHYGESLDNRYRTLRDPVCQRWTFDQFHHDRRNAVAFLEPVDDRDIGMAQTRQNLGFPLESGQTIRVGGDSRRKNLDRDLAFEIRVGGAIYLSHPTYTDPGVDFGWANATALGQ